MRLPAATLLGFALLAIGGAASAQAQPSAATWNALRISVRDATDLPIAAAEITLTAVTAAVDPGGAPGAVQYTAVTDDRGDATLDGVRPGTYTGHVESRGFNAFDIDTFVDVRRLAGAGQVAFHDPQHLAVEGVCRVRREQRSACRFQHADELCRGSARPRGVDDAEVRQDHVDGLVWDGEGFRVCELPVDSDALGRAALDAELHLLRGDVDRGHHGATPRG